MTPEQEAYLVKIANAGLAEEAEQIARNEIILRETQTAAARAVKLKELEAQAAKLIDDGIKAFEAEVKNE